MKLARVFLVAIFLLTIGIYLLVNRPRTQQSHLHNALILQKVQSLGELHTAKYSYQDIFEHQTSLQPLQWVSHLPGGTEIVRRTTQNTALVSAVGSIEAGVDLTKANIVKQGKGYVVELPPATLYEPTVSARIHDSKAGIFWRDENLGLRASETAKARIREAAIQQRLLEKASHEAKRRVIQFLQPMGQEVIVSIATSTEGL